MRWLVMIVAVGCGAGSSDAGQLCAGLDPCGCGEKAPECVLVSAGCFCLCDEQCPGEPSCNCVCGGGAYQGCQPADCEPVQCDENCPPEFDPSTGCAECTC